MRMPSGSARAGSASRRGRRATISDDAGVKPSDDRRVHQRDEAHVEGDRGGVGQRDRQAARPDPGGERDDQRIEAEPADDQRRSAHRPRGRRRCRRAAPAAPARRPGRRAPRPPRRAPSPSPARCRPSARRCRASRRPRRSPASAFCSTSATRFGEVAKRGLMTAKTTTSSERRRAPIALARQPGAGAGHAGELVGEGLAGRGRRRRRAAPAGRRPSRRAAAGR